MRMICLMAALLCVTLTSARSHELTPAIADLNVQKADDGFIYTIEITLNLEAIIAGVSPDHDTTFGTPEEAQYNALRQFEPTDLQDIYRQEEPFLDQLIYLEIDNTPLPVTLTSLQPGPLGDLTLPRDTIMTFSARHMDGGTETQFSWDKALGPIILRVTRPDGTEGFSGYLAGGQPSGPFNAIGSRKGFWSWLLGE